MNDYANLRDTDGVVHLSFGDPAIAMRSTFCEFEKGYMDALYASEDLRMTRAPVTCFACLRVKEKRDDKRDPSSRSRR